MFRRDEERGGTGAARRRLTAIRLAALPNGQDTLLLPRGVLGAQAQTRAKTGSLYLTIAYGSTITKGLRLDKCMKDEFNNNNNKKKL